MKAGQSSLNPFAESYIPFSRRGAANETNYSKHGNQGLWMRPHSGDTTLTQYHNSSHNYNAPDNAKFKGYNIHPYAFPSQHPKEMTEKQTLDEDNEMDLAYLLMKFPGIGDQSLTDAYMANRCDLDATLDMLNQLEENSVDSIENLPDTLDIGDVSESASFVGGTSLKPKMMAGDVGESSSGLT